MSPSGRAIRDKLGRALRQVRRESALGVGLAAAAVVPLALLVAWAVGDWGSLGPGPLAFWSLVVAAVVVVAVLLGRRWVAGADEATVAAAAERSRALPEGSLRGVLELGRELPRGSSGALFRRTETELAARVAGATTADLAGDVGRVVRRRWRRLLGGLAGLTLLAGAVGFAAPDRARAAWTPLLHPLAHLQDPLYPALVVTPGDTAVARGEPLPVSVRAELRRRVTLHWRSTGDVPRSRTLPVMEGRASATIGPVTSPVAYWVVAPDGAVSDTFTAQPEDPLMLVGLTMEVTYPAHVDRDVDHYQGEPPALRVPEGTRLRAVGRTSRSLADAVLRREDGAQRPLAVSGSAFRLDWTLEPGSSGRWDWVLGGMRGDAPVAVAPLEVEVVEDAPPEVRVAVPGTDTVMPSSLRQPILAEAVDDYGIAEGRLVFRRLDGRGQRGGAMVAELPVAGSAGRATLQGVLDATAQPLVAGDVVEYHVEVLDNSPAGQTGRSRTYRLRLPDQAELRDRARREAAGIMDETRGLVDRARELETGTRDLSRSTGRRGEAQRPGGGQGRSSSPPEQLGYDQAAEAGEVAAEYEEMLGQVAELQSRMRELERALEEAGLQDPELQRRLKELRELQMELASPEARERVDALREAAEALDPDAVRAALEQLARDQERVRRELERSLEMMRRAAAEQEMNALAREAEEIAAQQRALAEALREDAAADSMAADSMAAGGAEPSPADTAAAEARQAAQGEASESEGSESSSESRPSESGEEQSGPESAMPSPASESRASEQEELAERAEELSRSLETLQQQLMQMGEEASSSQAGAAKEQGQASQQSMESAAESARQQQGSKAAQQAGQAASQMADAARRLEEARQQMAESRQAAARESLQQATQEALGMAERQESLRQQMSQAEQEGGQGESLQRMRSEQAALQQGLQQLSRNLSETGQRSGMIDPEVARALERARMNMDRTMQGLEDGPRMPTDEAGRTVESLNELAMSLLENEAGLEQGQSSGGVEELLRRLSETAREQASLNGRVSALAPIPMGEQARAQQLQQLGREQQGVARRIGEASGMQGGREDVLGRLDQLSAEAARIARELEGGRLDPELMHQQERLFHRLLDAGRTLEREEYSNERVGATPGAVEATTPGALDPVLLDPSIRYPAPTAEQLERLPPAYRRLILEYFDRLNRIGEDDGGSR